MLDGTSTPTNKASEGEEGTDNDSEVTRAPYRARRKLRNRRKLRDNDGDAATRPWSWRRWIVLLLAVVALASYQLFVDSRLTAYDMMLMMGWQDQKGGARSTANETVAVPGNKLKQQESAAADPYVEELLQRFRTKGGVIIFIHNPKAGGSAVRGLLDAQAHEVKHGDIPPKFFPERNARHIAYWGTHSEQPWQEAKKRVDQILSGQQNNNNGTKIFVLEDHVWPLIPYVLIPALVQWRNISEGSGVPIFVVSQFRDPVSLYVSYFNYFNVILGREEATEENLLAKIHQENRQCQYFLSDPCPNNVDAIMSSQRLDLLQTIWEQVDWVFDTKTFADELLPLLTYMTKLQLRDQGVVQPMGYNHDITKLHVSKLSNATRMTLEERTALDQELYHNLTTRFGDFSKWKSYLDEKRATTKCRWNQANQTCLYPDGEDMPPGNLPAYLQ